MSNMDSSWLKSVTPYPFQMPNSHANAVIKTRIKTRHRQLLLDLPCLLYLCNRIQQRLFRRIIKPFNTDLELCHLINDCFGKQNHKTLKKLTYFLLGPEKAKILLVWWKFRVWSQQYIFQTAVACKSCERWVFTWVFLSTGFQRQFSILEMNRKGP